MTKATRSSAPDPGWDDTTAAMLQPDEAAPPVLPAGVYTPERGEAATADLVRALQALQAAQQAVSKAAPHALEHLEQGLNGAAIVAVVGILQDLRRDLAVSESYAATQAGRAVREGFLTDAGRLADGRQYAILKGANRKAWDHAAWKADARTQVLSGTEGLTVVDANGEAAPFTPWAQRLLSAVQEVHGSGAPRVTALKALGLTPDTYCESVPGPWSIKITGTTPDA